MEGAERSLSFRQREEVGPGGVQGGPELLKVRSRARFAHSPRANFGIATERTVKHGRVRGGNLDLST